MDSYNELIKQLKQQGYIKSGAIYNAFLKVRRKDFLPEYDIYKEHWDSPVPIGYGQTNSQPLTVAFMLELLAAEPGQKILDIGCGSGWTTALLAEITHPRGRVYGLELIPQLVEFARHNITKHDSAKKGSIRILQGNGYNGLPDKQPFDRILVSAAAPEIPQILLDQLKPGGTLVIPIGRPLSSQAIYQIIKLKNNSYQKQIYPGFVFVSLVNKTNI